MGNCSGIKTRAGGNQFITIRDAKFGKIKKNVFQTFTCFLAAAE